MINTSRLGAALVVASALSLAPLFAVAVGTGSVVSATEESKSSVDRADRNTPIPTVPPPTIAPTVPLVPTVPVTTAVGVPTVPTVPTVPVTAATIAVPTLAPVATAAGAGTVISDNTGRITVTVPATWADVDTRPGVRDDGGNRPTITASPDLDQWTENWAVPGLFLAAVPPTVDPATLLDAYSWRTACTAGPVTPYSDGRFVGSLMTWSNCGGGATSLTVIGARSADNTYTIYAQIQLISPDDPALQTILGSIGAVPGANPGEMTPPTAPSTTPPPVAATLLTGVVTPGSTTITDDTGRLSVAVDPTWIDVSRVPRANDDFSNRPHLDAAPNRDLYFQEWDAPGLELYAFPFRPDPYTLLVNQGWAADCDDGGVQTLSFRGFTGLMQTWTNCGGAGSRIINLAVAPADQSTTIFFEVQLPTADDTPLINALSSIAYNPNA